MGSQSLGSQSQGLSGTGSTHYYAPIRDPGGPTGPISGDTVYSSLRTHQGLTEGGLGGVGGEFLIRKTLPKVTESNENRHLDLGNILMIPDA